MSVRAQTFELDERDEAPASEMHVLGAAKFVCIVLAGVSLAFSLFDLVNIRSIADFSSLFGHVARSASAGPAEMPDDRVTLRIAMTEPRDAGTSPSPYVLPEPDVELSLGSIPKTAALPPTAIQPAKVVSRNPEGSADRKPQLKSQFLALASASPDDLLMAPPLDRLAAPVSLEPALPAPSAVRPASPAISVTPVVAPSDIGAFAPPPFLSPAVVPLPRPAPPREAESHEPTPAELLGLDLNAKERAKAERCLANAVYFESRSEPLRGQMAVAQVVMNRVFSPFYPKDVCGVVYQNAHRRLSCQFTFACDGKSKAIHDRGSWARSTRIAKQTLDGKLWIPEVAKSTHYHAQYVRPNWIHEMRRNFKTGLHLFYRPYNWGDGSDEQGWVKPVQTAAKKN